ncbi:uncharacterized protein LACBIDRAFT_303247 [Laccaria bicolor S238N-H82]|uniref:Predicted protein n=1 Tax=Laccaria bicolor (strain S238N-H82 / ATCC MYA-4686) TaxID=486041 RepID=B0DJ74_LACBS|nr:uncharacterized protein LACBIDRAFT_303247 [Laccaria bicolor S238N-H82]EDR05357.1 predicted protein [Laccaria bicolor S238N-H82]|eukprot:XP_001883915.1 predicted protein [Laccaria bicolor S238N-H82]
MVRTGISSCIMHTHVTHYYQSVYYWLYKDEGAMTSKTSFDPDDSSLSQIDVLSIMPLQTVSSLRSQIVNAEGSVCKFSSVQFFAPKMRNRGPQRV